MSRPLAKAREARAQREAELRDKNPDAAARRASLAGRWQALAQELLHACRAERRANELQAESLELKQKIARARALIEETLARRGRAKTALEQLKRNASMEAKP